MRAVITFLLVALMHIYTPFGLLSALAPSDGVEMTSDIAYNAGPRREVDVYAPRPTTTGAPVVVFFHGGGWETGSKTMYRFVGASLASHGAVVVVANYRLHPEIQFPAFMDDAAEAVAWAHANAGRFGGDPHRLFLMGYSAGAHIATLLSMSPGYLRAVQMSPSDVCGVIGVAGMYDFLPFANKDLQAVFGPRAGWPNSQPINYVSAQAPPMLLMAGKSDGTVDPGNTLRLADRLRAAGVSTTAVLYPGLSHTAMVAVFSDALAFLAPAREATLGFIQTQVTSGRCAVPTVRASGTP